MKTIKTFEIQSFEIIENVPSILLDPVTGKLREVDNFIYHKINGKIAKVDNDIYFGFGLHDLPPYPSMESDPTFQGNGHNPTADNNRFYLRKGTWRERGITDSEGDIIDVEEVYQLHALDYFNYKGITYIKFDKTFAGGKFKAKEEFILKNMSKIKRVNRKQSTIDAKFPDLHWL